MDRSWAKEREFQVSEANMDVLTGEGTLAQFSYTANEIPNTHFLIKSKVIQRWIIQNPETDMNHIASEDANLCSFSKRFIHFKSIEESNLTKIDNYKKTYIIWKWKKNQLSTIKNKQQTLFQLKTVQFIQMFILGFLLCTSQLCYSVQSDSICWSTFARRLEIYVNV